MLDLCGTQHGADVCEPRLEFAADSNRGWAEACKSIKAHAIQPTPLQFMSTLSKHGQSAAIKGAIYSCSIL